MTVFGLVRHGQTDLNLQRVFQGVTDAPLNEVGIEQAHRALDNLPPTAWDVVVSSSMRRAEKTGRIIAADHGIEFGGTYPELVEVDWGIAEGHPIEEVESLYPERIIPGQEDPQQAVDRACKALMMLAQRYPGKNVLVVVHGSLIRFLSAAILGRRLPSIGNATLTRLSLTDEGWLLDMLAGNELDPPVFAPRRDSSPYLPFSYDLVPLAKG
ncbi:histidine phosphatase family protein [Dermabacteraceae bacterium P13095]